MVSQLQSQISRLETELKNVQAVTDVTFGHVFEDGAWKDVNKDVGLDLYKTPIAGLYDTLKAKLAETNELRDAEAQKIEKTTAKLEASGATQKEIAVATAESVEEMDLLDRRASLLQQHLSTIKGVGGQLFTEALSKAQPAYQADAEVAAKARAEVSESYA
jgi:predicted ribosome quality control (RQC) complex YloA/Tae2 family protein